MIKILLLKYRISKLPKEIQRKLYIYCFRRLWRNYSPVTSKIPIWYQRKIDIDNEIFQAKLKNIHFLHLSFNTLPENKRWIMGCQCDYCLQVNKQHKRIQYYKQHNDSNFFYRNQPFSDIAWHNGPLGGYLINYDPLCDSKYEDLTKYALRTNNASLPFQYIY